MLTSFGDATRERERVVRTRTTRRIHHVHLSHVTFIYILAHVLLRFVARLGVTDAVYSFLYPLANMKTEGLGVAHAFSVNNSPHKPQMSDKIESP